MPGRIEVIRSDADPSAIEEVPVHQDPGPGSPIDLPTAPSATAAASLTSDRVHQVTVRNRRLRYLATYSEKYFNSPDLELADPILYDRLIRAFQTASEREAEGRAKGWSGILEADLERAEAKISAIASSGAIPEPENDQGETVTSKEEGIEMWRKAMTQRFLEGKDNDVDYASIDNNEDWDDWGQIERDAQDQYFDAESPSTVAGGGTDTGIQDF
ncbi:hypothetical protein RUND412_000477 [Rhizina undulata]